MKRFLSFLFFLMVCQCYSMNITFVGAYPQKIEGRSDVVKSMYSEICKKGANAAYSALTVDQSNFGFLNDCFSTALEKCFFCKKVPVNAQSSSLLITSASIGAKYGFYDSLVRLSKIANKQSDKIAEACCHAMLLLINPTHNRYALVEECLEKEASRIRGIFGETAPVDIPYIEDDSYRFRGSPVIFKFSSVNLGKIKDLLKTIEVSPLQQALLQVVNVWNTSVFLESVPLSLRE